jgi:patatin-like phospholipase/acyl hydrolase
MNKEDTVSGKKHILSIDGGGIRGIIPALVVAEIEARAGKPVSELFDVVAGTSTGGILAAGLTKPAPDGNGPAYRAMDVVDIYYKDGPSIFEPRPWPFRLGWARPKYPLGQLERSLKRRIGGHSLSDALCEVVIPTYDVKGRQPVVFTSERAYHSTVMDWPAWKVASATSAAPTYFPPVDLGDGPRFSCVDGGIYANNPAMVAVAAVSDAEAGVSPRECHVVSIGTGRSETPIDPSKADDWGAFGWVGPVIKSAMDGSSEIAHANALSTVGIDRFDRLQTNLQEASEDMDDASKRNMLALRTEADRLIKNRSKSIDRIVSKLT